MFALERNPTEDYCILFMEVQLYPMAEADLN